MKAKAGGEHWNPLKWRSQHKESGWRQEVLWWIGLAHGVMDSLSMSIWRCRYLCRRTKIQIFKSLVIPVLLYGCETWTWIISERDNPEWRRPRERPQSLWLGEVYASCWELIDVGRGLAPGDRQSWRQRIGKEMHLLAYDPNEWLSGVVGPPGSTQPCPLPARHWFSRALHYGYRDPFAFCDAGVIYKCFHIHHDVSSVPEDSVCEFTIVGLENMNVCRQDLETNGRHISA